MQSKRYKRAILGAGIALNILLLTFFKYLHLIGNTLNSLLSLFALPGLHIPPIHLPLGISFFTFQAMSYLVDVYRKDAQVEKDPIIVALYISMFPQLIAGPIVRFHTIADALHHRKESALKFSRGITFFIVGLAQKVLIANSMGALVDKIFDIPLCGS